jgi:hypothetical protein
LQPICGLFAAHLRLTAYLRLFCGLFVACDRFREGQKTKGTEPSFFKRSSIEDEQIERIEKKMKNIDKPESFKILDRLQEKLLAKCFEYDENCQIKALELLSLFINYNNRIIFESQNKVKNLIQFLTKLAHLRNYHFNSLQTC